MAGTGEGKKEEADYKRLHSFPLIRVGEMCGTEDNNVINCSVGAATYSAVTQSKLFSVCTLCSLNLTSSVLLQFSL